MMQPSAAPHACKGAWGCLFTGPRGEGVFWARPGKTPSHRLVTVHLFPSPQRTKRQSLAQDDNLLNPHGASRTCTHTPLAAAPARPLASSAPSTTRPDVSSAAKGASKAMGEAGTVKIIIQGRKLEVVGAPL